MYMWACQQNSMFICTYNITVLKAGGQGEMLGKRNEYGGVVCSVDGSVLIYSWVEAPDPIRSEILECEIRR